MQSILLITMLVLQISISQPSVCYSHPPPLDLSSLPIKVNSAYTFKIHHQPTQVTLARNQSGTFFLGNFSKLLLEGKNLNYQYSASSFSFKYPPQHRIADVTQEVLEMQINYQLVSQNISKWKHQSVVLSVNFLVTEYAPGDGFTMGKQINQNLQNGSIVDFNTMIPLVSGLNILLYKGVHSESPQDEATLWLVRRQLLLMSEHEFSEIKRLFLVENNGFDLQYHGLLRKISDVNEISETLEEKEPDTVGIDL